MRKTIVIVISLLFIIGIASQVSARKIHCWDLNENYECDIETEDMNNDGKCSSRDCETEEPYYAVPQQTGQTICYDEIGVEIDCKGTGQDGEYQMGVVCPDPRFTDNGDGTVTDNCTGLIWLKNANCFGMRSWADALSDCNDLASDSCSLSDGSKAGDWRLPNVKELQSLIDISNRDPALPSGHPFNMGDNNMYWSASTLAKYTYFAWHMIIVTGRVSSADKSQNYSHYVWPVRGGN